MNLKPGDKIILTYTGERRVPKEGEFWLGEWGRGISMVQYFDGDPRSNCASVILTAEHVRAAPVNQ